MENSKVVIRLILVSVFRMCNCQLSTNGRCFRNKSTFSSGETISVTTIFCCRNFEPIGTNNTCKGCEIGFTSDGSKCEPCPNGKYGEKCGETCFCNDSERCHHENGCVSDKKVCEFGFTSDGSKCEPCRNRKYGEKCGDTCFCNDNERCHHKYGCISDREGTRVSVATTTFTTTIHNLAKEAITSREHMLIVIIILLSLLLLLGLLHKCWNTSINPLKGNDRKTNEIGHGQRKDEEGIESVYNEIDELAMNTITSRTSFHHSYLELPNILTCSSKVTTKGNTCNTPISFCSTQLSSKSQPVQQKTRNKLKEHTNNQYSPEGSECSDIHICSTSFSKLHSIETMFEYRESSLQSNERIQNEYSFSKESTLIGFGRSISNNKLTLKDVRSQTRTINIVDNPIYHETVNRQPKSTAWFTKSKTI